MLLDMHVHTTRYSKCGRQTPREMARRAREVGLDGVVITEHNEIWTDEEIAELRQEFPDLTLLRGVEVSARGCHILVYGITDFAGFEKGMPAADVVKLAHERGAVAVWAHPLQHSLVPDPKIAAAGFDACETRSINIDELEHSEYDALAERLGVPVMWNSDAHHDVVVGTYATRFHGPVRDERELAERIRERAFQPVEQKTWSRPAWRLRIPYWEEAIRKMIAEGVTDPEAIKRKTGASLARIQAMLEQAKR